VAYFKSGFSNWVMLLIILLVISAESCAVQHPSNPVSTSGDEQSFSWRIEIKVQPNGNDVYGVLAVLESNPQPISLNQFNHFSEKALPGTIVVFITATNDQVAHLRQSLLESGALVVFENKSNNN
jgi:hypothetical protein